VALALLDVIGKKCPAGEESAFLKRFENLFAI